MCVTDISQRKSLQIVLIINKCMQSRIVTFQQPELSHQIVFLTFSNSSQTISSLILCVCEGGGVDKFTSIPHMQGRFSPIISRFHSTEELGLLYACPILPHSSKGLNENSIITEHTHICRRKNVISSPLMYL